MLKIASSNISPVREIDKDHLSTTFLVHPWYALWNDTIGWAGLVWVLMGNSKNWSIWIFRLSIWHVTASGHQVHLVCAVLSTSYRMISHVYLAL